MTTEQNGALPATQRSLLERVFEVEAAFEQGTSQAQKRADDAARAAEAERARAKQGAAAQRSSDQQAENQRHNAAVRQAESRVNEVRTRLRQAQARLGNQRPPGSLPRRE